MNITKQQLQQAALNAIITREQADKLYDFLQEKSKNNVRFSFTHVLYYLGGFIAITAMTLFMGLSFESFGGAGILSISLLYAALGLKLTGYFASKKYVIPAGICATFVVCLTPLAIYGLQQWLGIWPDESTYKSFHRTIRWHWLYMELGTILIGMLMVWKYKYAFLVMPIAITLWYMSMDVTSMFYGENFSWHIRAFVSLCAGLVMLVIAFGLDVKWHKQADYALWIYLFGVMAFWCGLTGLDSDNEFSKFIYFCINLIMIVVGVILARRVFVIFGALGAMGYLGYLSSTFFKADWGFPISLSLIGLGIIYLGTLWQRNEKVLTQKMRTKLPQSLRILLEAKD